MANTPKLYRRLTRATARIGSYTSLWLGADHLMVVTSTGYQESYSRLQFSDLKAVFLTKTERRMWWAMGWGMIAAIGGLTLLVIILNKETPIFSLFLFVVGAVGLTWNHLLGEGCSVYVVTGVQTAELTPLVRAKKARRVIAQLQPLIAQAQADLVVATPVETSVALPPAPPASTSALFPETAAAATATAEVAAGPAEPAPTSASLPVPAPAPAPEPTPPAAG